jgi:hypothetical protein
MKNYTSSVNSATTVARIEALLAKAGAQNIHKGYENGVLLTLSFSVMLNGFPMLIQLPANQEAVYQVMKERVRKPHKGTLQKIKEQAGRTAWKLMQDWVEVQLSLIEMQQIEFLQAFFPYITDGHRTFYQIMKENNFKQLQEKN